MTTEEAKDLIDKSILVSVLTNRPYQSQILKISPNGQYVKVASSIGIVGLSGWYHVSEVVLLDVLE